MNSQKIAILTDSCCDLTPDHIGDHPIYVVPLKIHCPDGEFDDGVSITATDIYARQAAGQLPKTSLPDGAALEAVMTKIFADGYERVVAIFLSSGLSGTFNLARLLGEAVNEHREMRVFDSLSGALGEGAMVLQTALDIESGMPWETLVEKRIPALIAGVSAFFSVDTLEYLEKGGRIGKVTALAGTMLNIKPILTFAEDGQLQSAAKVRGRRGVEDKLIALLREKIGSRTRYNLAVAHGGAPEEMARLRARMETEFPHHTHFWQAEMDATLSVYIGAGVLGAGVMLLED